jgi:hypothetical protein
MPLARWVVVPLSLACCFAACSDPDTASDSSAAGAAGESPQVSGSSSGGSSGAGQSAGEGSLGGAGDLATGGAVGAAGQASTGGSGEAGGAPSSADCLLPNQAPVSGSECPASCEGELVAYEDCAGDGLLQVACASNWFVIESACGDHLCQDPVFNGESCGPGAVCALMQGGAQIPQCMVHDCGTGPITCQCLSELCPGCVQTGVLDFTCNTCPSGQCP